MRLETADWLIQEGISEAGVPREQLFITSKTMCTPSAEKDFESDLKHLNVSSVDLLLIHSPRYCGLFGSVCSTWKVYNRLLAAGSTRAIGVSNFGLSDLKGLEACGSVPVLNQAHAGHLLSDSVSSACCHLLCCVPSACCHLLCWVPSARCHLLCCVPSARCHLLCSVPSARCLSDLLRP